MTGTCTRCARTGRLRNATCLATSSAASTDSCLKEISIAKVRNASRPHKHGKAY